ncbi:MAG: protein-L-isoaspartate O-methyltransferase [Candidatus Bipolaricaulota bacterium]|nr:protein-L-isoaspartate O-methyltransferase [Candidatus Bipolaricaulota bacterium]MDW8030704.1 protein-L-isoaspartate O-methyltransferase [Candidatus Bipolaricaulota bacterium]
MNITVLMRNYVDAIEQELACRGASIWCGGNRHLSDPVRTAFLKVKRHLLLKGFYDWEEDRGFFWVPLGPSAPAERIAQVYTASTSGLPIKISPKGEVISASSSPVLIANMLEYLKLQPGFKVLEIGTGTGYNAALMAEIVGDPALIHTIEIQPDLAESAKLLLAQAGYGGIHIHCGDGYWGLPEDAPYDRIIVTTCSSDISPCWLEQLSPSGWMLVPLEQGGGSVAPLTQVFKDGSGRVLDLAGFGQALGMLGGSRPWEEVPKEGSSPPCPTILGRKLFLLRGSDWDFVCFVYQLYFFLALNASNCCLQWYPKTPETFGLLWDEGGTVGGFLTWEKDGWVRISGSNKRIC